MPRGADPTYTCFSLHTLVVVITAHAKLLLLFRLSSSTMIIHWNSNESLFLWCRQQKSSDGARETEALTVGKYLPVQFPVPLSSAVRKGEQKSRKQIRGGNDKESRLRMRRISCTTADDSRGGWFRLDISHSNWNDAAITRRLTAKITFFSTQRDNENHKEKNFLLVASGMFSDKDCDATAVIFSAERPIRPNYALRFMKN